MQVWKRFFNAGRPYFAVTEDAQSQLAGAIGGAAAMGLAGIQTLLTADGAAALVPGAVYNIAKTSAIALSVAAPGAAMVGRSMTFITSTDFAHVVTFTGTTLMDGTAGLNTTWTTTAVAGCGLIIIGVSATRWAVVAFNLGTIAP